MSEQIKKYAVSVEVCHIMDREKAEFLADKIKNRLSDLNEDVYVCVSDYEQVKQKVSPNVLKLKPGISMLIEEII